ncbi:MAG TPA: patatin-like phospholipase family protein [Nitrososphaeraceae archaeon]
MVRSKTSINNNNNNSRHKKSRKVENVLIMQGGGSLGAFGCGVFKALVRKGVELDVVCGTSIGGINAAIIAGSKNNSSISPEQDLENFWMELAESSYNIIPDIFFLDYDKDSNTKTPSFNRISSSSVNSALFGVPKMFMPRWYSWKAWYDTIPFMPLNWTYIYDHSPLAKTLEKYLDYSKLSPSFYSSSSAIHLIISAVNVLTAEPMIFDSAKIDIKPKHLLACCGYPIYGFPWIEVEKGVYAWDGSLLNNTPLREVIQASPRNDKHLYIVENYPKHIDRLPSNMGEVLDRARDIIFSDKTKFTIKMSRLITRQIKLIEELYDVFENARENLKLHSDKVSFIEKEYDDLINTYGAEILSINRIIKDRIEKPHILKNADFSPKTVKDLIYQGEKKATEALEGR